MAVTKEYWDYARECAQWAVEARTNRKRITFSTWPKPGLSLHYSKPVLSKGTADKYRPQTEAALAPTPRSQSARELSFATREPQQLL